MTEEDTMPVIDLCLGGVVVVTERVVLVENFAETADDASTIGTNRFIEIFRLHIDWSVNSAIPRNPIS